MTTLSKQFFESAFCNYECRELLHPWEKSCTKAQAQFVKSCFAGAVKYYGLFYLVSALLKYKEWDEKYLINHLICYSKSLTAGTLIGSTFLTAACILRSILGRFYYNTGTFLPGTIGGLFVFIASPSKRDMISQVFLQLIMESFVNKLEISGTVRLRHVGIGTLLFMITNAYLLYLLRLETNKDGKKKRLPIWIFRPPRPSSKNTTNGNPCNHCDTEFCYDYILEGVKTYFKYGCIVELCKIIIKNFSTIKSSPLAIPSLLLKLNIKTGLFAAGYVGIYRAITCYLCQKHGKDDPRYAIVGGFASGVVYPFFPLFNLLLTAISSCIFIHLWKVEDKYRVPIGNLLFAICLGYSFNVRIFTPNACPSSLARIISSITNGRADDIVNHIQRETTMKVAENISNQLLSQKL
ncbi:transmembrane protein 135-like [Chrysoperla carnea]|uniref:transmembrane protein 135-like n=1 Tax=Chrysoperla carnea TaxID=189513 RepID=UPI001D09026D|nr:transmembrane protein 135-like [Chrysoperla carnea]